MTISFLRSTMKVPVLVHPRDVAGVQPAVPEGRRGFRGGVPVPLHDLGAADHELTGFTLGHFPLAGLRVDNPDVGVRQRQADASHLMRAVDRVDVGPRRCLGEAVPFDNLGTGQSLELGLHLDRKRRRAADADLDRLEIVLLDVLELVDREIDDGSAREDRRAVAGNHLGDEFGIQQRHHHAHHGRGDADRGVQPDGESVDVKERHDAQKDFVPFLEVGQPVPHLGEVGDEVPVSQHRALGDPGCAPRVLENRHVVRPHGHPRGI